MNEYINAIDNNIAERHLLKHPFYLAWTRGELSKDALADYGSALRGCALVVPAESAQAARQERISSQP